MDDKELLIPDRDDVLVAKTFALARFAMGWLAFVLVFDLYVQRVVISQFTWVMIFFLVILYCPYLFSLYMERMWRPENA